MVPLCFTARLWLNSDTGDVPQIIHEDMYTVGLSATFTCVGGARQWKRLVRTGSCRLGKGQDLHLPACDGQRALEGGLQERRVCIREGNQKPSGQAGEFGVSMWYRTTTVRYKLGEDIRKGS